MKVAVLEGSLSFTTFEDQNFLHGLAFGVLTVQQSINLSLYLLLYMLTQLHSWYSEVQVKTCY